MIIGVGIDFVEINRIELVFKKWGSVFSRKILSKKEFHFFPVTKTLGRLSLQLHIWQKDLLPKRLLERL